MKKYFGGITAAAAVLFFASCAGNDAPEVDKSIMPANATNNSTAPANPAVDAARTTTPANTTPVVTATPTPAAAPAATGSVAQGTNPPHGQPGHRCDIAVGAPLNSAPAATKPVVQPAVTTPAANAATPVNMPAPVTTTAPGMNPPHGQPGHDCAIPVGAPLKKG